MTNSENPRKWTDTMYGTYIVAVLAACNAEIFTYPLDLCKTRLQIQGEIANSSESKLVGAPYKGTLSTAMEIIKKEGVFALWRGIGAQFLRHSIYSGTRLVVYWKIREDYFHSTKAEYFPLWQSAVCGSLGGGIGQWIANPADIARIQLQIEGKRRILGLPPRVTGIRDAFVKVVKSSGWLGLWKGSVPNIQRAVCVTLGDVSGYDVSKRFILSNTNLGDSTITHILASSFAGFAGAVLGTPSDLVRTRVMNQPLGKDGRGLIYKNTWDCFYLTAKNEGFFGLYKGFIPLWVRLVPWALVNWVTFEKIKWYLGGEQF